MISRSAFNPTILPNQTQSPSAEVPPGTHLYVQMPALLSVPTEKGMSGVLTGVSRPVSIAEAGTCNDCKSSYSAHY